MRGGYIIIDAGKLEYGKNKKFEFPDGFIPDDSKPLYVKFSYETPRGVHNTLMQMNYLDRVETEKTIGNYPVTAFIYYAGESFPGFFTLEIFSFANSFYIELDNIG